MTAIQELQAAITAVAEKAGPSIVGIGSRQRGSGVVLADGQVLTNAHNIRGDEVTVTFADGRSTRGQRRRRSTSTATSRSSTWTRARPRRSTGRTAARSPSGPWSSAPRRRPVAATRVTFGTVSAVARAFRGPGGRKIAGSIEHTAPLAPGLVRRGAARRRGSARRAEHEPDRRGLLPRAAGGRRRFASGSMPSAAGSRRRGAAPRCRRRPVVRRSPAAPIGRPAGARRPAGPWRRGRQRRRTRPGSSRATSSSRSPERPSRTRTTSSRRSHRPVTRFEVKIVRGLEERTVSVGGRRGDRRGLIRWPWLNSSREPAPGRTAVARAGRGRRRRPRRLLGGGELRSPRR